MDLLKLTLEQLSPRALNLLASFFGRRPVRVLITRRAANPVTAILESPTLVLHPGLSGVYDAILAAWLLQHRALRKSGPEDPDSKDRWLTAKARRELVPQAHRDLHDHYPGMARLSGRFRPGADLNGLYLVQRSVQWHPLPPLPRRPPAAPTAWGPSARLGGAGNAFDVEFTQVPEVEITGAEEDWGWLLDAVRDGHVAARCVPGLEDLPYVTVPFRLSLAEAAPTMEVIEEQLARSDAKDLIGDLVQCIRRKSEVRQELFSGGRHQTDGVRLDTNRLVDAVVARRVGLMPHLFRRRRATFQPVFDPREHLVVLAFDFNDLRRSARLKSGNEGVNDLRSELNLTHRMLAIKLTAYQRLEIDCEVLGFADQVVRLPDGRPICLHLVVNLKEAEAPFDESFWNRLVRLLHRPPEFPGTPACFHPLSLGDMVNRLDRAAAEGAYSYWHWTWWARRGMPPGFAQFRTADFLTRVADHVDGEVQKLERRLEGTLDTTSSFLPAELKKHGRPGRYLQNIRIG